MTRAEARSAKRKEVVEAIVVRNEPVGLVARIYNIPRRTVFDWLARYRNGGWDALREGSKRGRPRKLSGEDMQWVYDAITMGSPLNHKFEFCLWTLNIIRTMIANERAVKLSKSAVSRLLGHLGLSPQRPVYKGYKQDPKKIEQYLKQTFPEVVERAQELGAEIYFVDEAAVRSDAHRDWTWGKVGQTAVVRDSGGRFGLKVISAVTLRGDMRFGFIEGKMNSARFIQFLKKLRKDADRPIIVIADNARYHHSKQTQKFIEAEADSISMAFLPAYSPELNPDEQVWNHAKARLSKLPVLNAQDMKNYLTSIFRSMQKQKSLIKSFFQLADTKYIAEIVFAKCGY
jgi:transposase